MIRNMPAVLREYMRLELRRTSPEGISVKEYQRWLVLKRHLSKHFQPDLSDKHEDRRDSVRVPARLRLGFQSYGEVRECLMTYLSRGGIFIATQEPLPLGTKLQIRIYVEESGLVIDVPAEIASHNSGPGLLSEELGMGVKFINLSEEQDKAVRTLYERSLRKAIEGI